MKTQILLTLGVVVLTAAAFTLQASDALLTPRASDNQIRTVARTGVDRGLVAERNAAGTLLTPRAEGNQMTHVAGMEKVLVQCPVLGSPRQVTALGSAARMSCCNATLAECSSMDQMK